VIAGYDPKDELTVFSMDRKPTTSYASSAVSAKTSQPLKGIRIGVVREYMDKKLFTAADVESIDIIDRELSVLKKLGATLVDPGEGGALFQSCIAKYDPHVHNSAFTKQFGQMFPFDGNGKPVTDHTELLAKMFSDTGKFPKGKDAPSIRSLGTADTTGERKYMMERYLQLRGDTNIKNIQDLIDKSKFYQSGGENSGFMDKKRTLETTNKEWQLDIANRLQTRWALQQIALQCMAEQKLDALTYPTGNIPPPKLAAPSEPSINGRASNAWTLLGANGFPAITVPAGFTTVVYDRVADANAKGGTRLVGPIAAKLPVGIDFLSKPFAEPTLIKIAAAYESASKHRTVPVGFGPIAGEP
jgi:amidase